MTTEENKTTNNITPETPASENPEPSFDITITNGAAKMLQRVMEGLNEESAKEAVSLGLQVLDYALKDNAELIIKRPNGEEVRVVLKKPI